MIICTRRIEGVVDAAKAGIQSSLDTRAGTRLCGGAGGRGDLAADVLNQIAREGVDVVPVGGVAGISTRGDQISRVRADVAKTGDEAGGDLEVEREVEVDGVGAAEV